METDAWYPVAFLQDLPESGLQRVQLEGRGYVLMRRAKDVRCFVDRCPHRGARLSDGRVRGDTIECLYHGWRFDPEGAPVEMPQLPAERTFPDKACLVSRPVRIEQGLVFVWSGEGAPSGEGPPTLPALDANLHCVDYAVDLPYEADALIENVLDLAHIHVVHDGVRGGGVRELAGPIDFEITDFPEGRGFEASFRTREVGDASPGVGALVGARVEFRAPGLVHYESSYRDPALRSGLGLYAVPLDRARCRLLYRAYTSFPEASDTRRPRWREHLHQNRLLEQDMAVIAGQVADARQDGRPLREQWLPLKTSDALVLRFRRWVDELGDAAGGRLGLSRADGAGPSDAQPVGGAQDRLTMHTAQCASCRVALGKYRERERWSGRIAYLALCAGVLFSWLGPGWLTPACVAASVLAYALRQDAKRWISELTEEHAPRFAAPRGP